MRNIILTISLFCMSLIGSSQTSAKNLVPQDSVIINGGWRFTYLESPLYIKNKDYVVYQYLNTRKILYPDMQSFRIVENNRDCAIAVDKNGVYSQGIFVKADTTDIKVVGEKYTDRSYQYLWKNKDKVFKDTVEIEGIDAASFEPIECFNGVYFKDKNYVYYFDKKIDGSDGSSVNKSCNEVCYDNNHIYIDGKVATYNGKKLKSINSILAKTNNLVIDRSIMQPLKYVDVRSIVKLSDRYAMDKNNVYFGTLKMPIEKENLKNVKVWEQINSLYVTDQIKIYVGGGQYQINLDAKTFGMLPHSDLIYDKDGVYQRKTIDKKNNVILEKYPFKYKEPLTAKNIYLTDNNLYIIYANQIYDMLYKKLYTNLTAQEIQLVKDGNLLPIDKNGFDDESSKLKSIGYGYSKKENSIFYEANQLSQIQDSESFRPLNYMYSKDKYNVYALDIKYTSNKTKYTLSQIEGADPNTLELNVLPFDKNFVYIGDKPVISSKDIEFLAIYSGYRPGCGLDRTPSSNHIFMKNAEGYWLMETTYLMNMNNHLTYLGKTFNPKWNKVFTDFELAKKEKS